MQPGLEDGSFLLRLQFPNNENNFIISFLVDNEVRHVPVNRFGKDQEFMVGENALDCVTIEDVCRNLWRGFVLDMKIM